MRYLTPQERQRIENECDMLKVNINRMCVTDDIKEFDKQAGIAVRRILNIENIVMCRFDD